MLFNQQVVFVLSPSTCRFGRGVNCQVGRHCCEWRHNSPDWSANDSWVRLRGLRTLTEFETWRHRLIWLRVCWFSLHVSRQSMIASRENAWPDDPSTPIAMSFLSVPFRT